MTIEPFSGKIEDGKLWGRGSCDTKGTGAAMLCALRDSARGNTRVRGPNNVALLFAVDEESRKAGVTSFVREHLSSFSSSSIADAPETAS